MQGSESGNSREQELKEFWDRIDKLANEIGIHVPDRVDAAQIVREGKREFIEQTGDQDDAIWEDLKRISILA
jgi:hypothetical protein